MFAKSALSSASKSRPLSGAVPPTSGDAVLDGMSILTEQDAIRRHVGYCPQHDALEKLIFRNQDTVSGCVQIRLETSSAGDLVSGKSENSHQTQPRLVTAAQ